MKKLPMLTKSFLGFSICLVIPLIIAAVIFYYNMIDYSEYEISKSSIINLQTISRLNDQLVDSITKQTIRISLDIALLEIFDIRQYNEIKNHPENMVKLMKVYQMLSETTNIDTRIQSIYMYASQTDYVITSNRGIVKRDEFTDTNWIEEYNKNRDQSGTLWLNSRLYDNVVTLPENNLNVITCILPFKTLMIDYDGAFVVNLFERQLYRHMNEIDSEYNGYVFIVDGAGVVVSHEDKSLIGKTLADRPYIREVLDSPESTGYFLFDIGRKKQMYTYYKSEFNNWIYVGVTPMDSLLGKSSNLVNRIILVMVALMLIGIILSYIVSRSMYNPVKKLMLDIRKRKGVDFKEAGNEMAVISRVFDTLAKQEDALSNALEKNRRELQEKYITDLLKGNLDQANSTEMLSAGIQFKYKYLVCAVISIDRFDLFNEKYSHDQQYYMKMMILKACEEITEPSFDVCGVLYEKNKIAVVINMENYEPDNTGRRLQSNLESLQREVAKVMSNTITIGVGSFCNDLHSLSISFSEAQEALSNRILKGSGSIIFYSSISESDTRYFYPYHAETHILNFLRLGSRQDVFDSINELINEIRTRKGISPDNITQIFIQLIGNTVKFLVEQNINIANIFGGDYNIYQKLTSKETLEDIQTWLMGFYSGVLQYICDTQDMNRPHADKVMDYVHKNYKANIDTTAIAASTGLSYSSVGRIVRSKTGKNILEYMNGLRIEEAKRLLRQTNMTVSDIALNVGYNNDQSFSRFFKKFEGVTPGEFRSLQNTK